MRAASAYRRDLPERVEHEYERLRQAANDLRCARSQRLYGHPGAHVPSVPKPTIGDAVAAAQLALARERGEVL